MAAARLVRTRASAPSCSGVRGSSRRSRRGASSALREGPADAVVVGFHRDFDYERMKVAADGDPGRRGPDRHERRRRPTRRLTGRSPAAARSSPRSRPGSETVPVVAGKPHPAMADLVREVVGDVPLLMVGDRPDTDGLFAVRLGCDVRPRALGHRRAATPTCRRSSRARRSSPPTWPTSPTRSSAVPGSAVLARRLPPVVGRKGRRRRSGPHEPRDRHAEREARDVRHPGDVAARG